MKKPYIICHMMPSVFDGREMSYPLTHLTLSDVKMFDGGAVWLQYKTK